MNNFAAIFFLNTGRHHQAASSSSSVEEASDRPLLGEDLYLDLCFHQDGVLPASKLSSLMQVTNTIYKVALQICPGHYENDYTEVPTEAQETEINCSRKYTKVELDLTSNGKIILCRYPIGISP
ncbi:uncharacterized protein LOC144456327 [Phascolarctos cinereus]